MSLKLGNTTISGVTTPIDGSIAIGQIISSIIPLTDAGLHLLDGALIQGGGVYDAFIQYIANLVYLYPQCFTDETTWQNTVNSKGVCGKFVYNSINNTVRLPKITGFIEGTIDSNALGELVNAGLPNITGQLQFRSMNGTANIVATNPDSGSHIGAFSYTRNGGESWGNSLQGQTGSTNNSVVDFNASLSNTIYGNSNTVQPQSIKVFYYIVIATTTKTDIEVDIDEVITDLNSKANDTDVVHKIGNETISGYKTFNNSIHFKNSVYVDAAAGDEGGEIEFAKAPNSSLIGNVHLDIYKNSIRIFGPASNGNFNTVMTADIEQNALFAPASDVNGSIVTTINKSKSANGYFKLGNGLIIQWGSVGSSEYSQLTITLPTPFSNTDYKVVLTQEYNNTVEYNANAYVRSKTTTNFNILGQKTAIAYIAIGY